VLPKYIARIDGSSLQENIDPSRMSDRQRRPGKG